MWREGGVCLAHAAADTEDYCRPHYTTGHPACSHHVHACVTVCLLLLQLAEVVSWLQATVHQIVGVADATVEAPNGHLIKPLVEPLSEDIKYLLFDLSVGEADVCLLEGGGVLRLQVSAAVSVVLTSELVLVLNRVQDWTWGCASCTVTVKHWECLCSCMPSHALCALQWLARHGHSRRLGG